MNKAAWTGKCSNLYQGTFMKMGMMRKQLRPTLNCIFVSPYPTRLTGMGQSVGIFLTPQIGYPLNLIVYSKTYLKRPLKKRHKIVLLFKTDYRTMQIKTTSVVSIFEWWFRQVLLYRQ